jgi:hypothetical protein
MKGIADNSGKIIQHWPPFYPASLCAASLITGLDSLEAGKFLNAAAIGAFFLMFNIILKSAVQDKWIIWLANLLLLFSLSLIVFIMFWSEGLFLLLLLAFLYFFLEWIKLKYWHLLILSAIFAGLMILTRYAGIGLIAGAIIFILFFNHDKIRARLSDFIVFTAFAGLILAPWLIYTRLAGEGKEIRSFEFHPVTMQHISDMGQTFYLWSFPVKFGLPVYILAPVLFILLFLAIISAFRFIGLKAIFDHFRIFSGNYSAILLTMIVSYIIFLLISISFFDAHTQLNNRILSSLFPMVVLLICPLLKVLTRELRVIIPVIILLSFILISNSAYAYRNWSSHFNSGNGYTSRDWRFSETVERIEEYEVYQIYTNGFDVLKLYLPGQSQSIRILPSWINPNTKIENKNFEQDLLKMKKDIKTGQSVLIYFENIDWRYYYVKKEDLLEIAKDFKLIRYNDGFVILAATEDDFN